MKKFKLLINPFAEEDIENGKEYYDDKKEGLGNEFLTEVKKTVKRIEENPYQFPKEFKQTRKAIIRRFPYTVFFYVKDTLINVFAVFHSSRNPSKWKKRI